MVISKEFILYDSSIKVKEISFSYHVEKVFTVDIPALQHGNDGLIYTCVSTPYTPGTDSNMWDIFLSTDDLSYSILRFLYI